MEIYHLQLILLIESAFKIDYPKASQYPTTPNLIAANERLLIKFVLGRVAKARVLTKQRGFEESF